MDAVSLDLLGVVVPKEKRDETEYRKHWIFLYEMLQKRNLLQSIYPTKETIVRFFGLNEHERDEVIKSFNYPSVRFNAEAEDYKLFLQFVGNGHFTAFGEQIDKMYQKRR